MEPFFQEYLANQGTVVKPCCWQRQNHICGRCPYHGWTGEEVRVPYAEFHRFFGFPYRSTDAICLLGHKGTLLAHGHPPIHQDPQVPFPFTPFQQVNPQPVQVHRVALPYRCCVSKIYNFSLKYQEVTLSIYFSQLYYTEDGFPTAMWNREALGSLSSLWPLVTLQRLLGGRGSTLHHSTQPSRTLTDRQNPHQINNLSGIKPYFRKAFPQAIQGKTSVLQKLEAFSSLSPASHQPFQMLKGSLLPPMSQSHSVLFPGMFLPFQREHLYPRPKNIIRHLKMPKDPASFKHKPIAVKPKPWYLLITSCY
uniref:Uncharacterized protein n=1 Tax=Melopsittacus undulatus TaxID=13146 RepID=A0A8C6JRR8_MELUD